VSESPIGQSDGEHPALAPLELRADHPPVARAAHLDPQRRRGRTQHGAALIGYTIDVDTAQFPRFPV
jgi:hypothetical protein